MKEWLKQFTTAFIIDWWLTTDDQTKEQFISDYLLDHPLPGPSDEEIKVEALKRRTTNTGYQYLHDVKWFSKGAKWYRKKMEGKV